MKRRNRCADEEVMNCEMESDWTEWRECSADVNGIYKRNRTRVDPETCRTVMEFNNCRDEGIF